MVGGNIWVPYNEQQGLELSMNAGQKAVRVEVSEDELTVELLDGRSIIVPLAWYPRLLHATPAQRANWKIAGAGFGIHWPDVDEDLSVEGLLRGAPAPRTLSQA
jgi:Protein of unknown function (DUF2442)